MYRKRKIRAIMLMVVITNTLFINVVQGQKMVKPFKGYEGRIYFTCGGNIIDIKSLNSRLQIKGYPTFSNNFISLGGGFHGVIKKVIIGGEGHGLIGRVITEGTKQDFKTSLSAGYGFFNLGYLIYLSKTLHIYPIFGLGGGGMRLNIIQKKTAPFDEVLENPTRGVELSTGGLLVNLAVGVDYLLKLVENEKEEGGLVFGLRIGYTFAPLKRYRYWQMDGVEISDGPELGITGPYFYIMFGGGGVSR